MNASEVLSASVDPTKVMYVRCPRSRHSQVKELVLKRRTSLNRLITELVERECDAAIAAGEIKAEPQVAGE